MSPQVHEPRSAWHDALPTLKPALAVLSVAMSARYLFWRAAETLNFQGPVQTAVSVLLLLAEVYGVVGMTLFFFQAMGRKPESSAPKIGDAELPSVDVFVTIFDEPAAVLYKTLICCANIDYPKEKLTVYVLDDGPRASIKALTEKFGFRYVARPEHRYAKAGNVNYGLTQSHGDVILLLDCDHVPVRDILRETVGYFKDRRVGYVQLPHHFYNPDVFQHNLHLDEDLAHEQDLFFRVIQPGRHDSNAVVFSGSSALLRRSSLVEIGGMQVETAIEDTHTGMKLNARGYKGVYHDKILSAGLSPETFDGYLTQRKRWARGGVQVFILDNPLLLPGLTLTQRLQYFTSLLYFFHGWSRIIFLTMPLTFLVFGWAPIVASMWSLLGYFIPHYVCAHISFNLLAGRYRNPFWSDVYEAAGAFALSWTAVEAVLNPQRLVFNVTPKGAKQMDHRVTKWRLVVPHMILMSLMVVGMICATIRFQNTGMRLDAYMLSSLWAVFNLMLLGCAIEGARQRHQLRSEYRVPRDFPCVVTFHGRSFPGRVVDMGGNGIMVRLESREHMPPLVHVRLPEIPGEINDFDAEVVHQEEPYFGGHRLGLLVTDESEPLRESLVRRAFSLPGSWENPRQPFAAWWLSLWNLGTSMMRPRMRVQTRQRRARARIKTTLPIELVCGADTLRATLRDISITGLSLQLADFREISGECELRLPLDETVVVRARVVRRVQDKKRKEKPFYGLRFVSPAHLAPAHLQAVEETTNV